ncbi:MAG TPA: enolase C-terminal domain-like protein [Burkholderiales bacterium]|nr:enolase C-terminal domain-like protein [Burkholderiales bacterium]
MGAPALRVVAVEFRERPVRLRMPFRFGVVTLTEAPQAFVRVRIRLDDGREGWGAGAEMLAPKWFDKNLALSNEDNFDQLRLALGLARDAYLDGAARTAFGHFAAHYREVIEAGARRELNPLVACFGPAQLDRAILDALCRLHRMSFYEAVQGNFAGIEPAAVAPDLAGFDIDAFLARLQPAETIDARHTVGLVDVIGGHPGQVNDGLPESLEEVVATYGHRWYKLKVGGNVDEDVRRLADVAAVLDASGRDYRASLDGNEQYDDLEALRALLARMNADPKLARLLGAIAFIEQPINRKHALDRDVSAVSRTTPVIVDESDSDLDAFPRAKALGYSGVSSKMCKGLYKSILNAARCALWSAPARRYFMTAEDLTTQAGLAVQQDLALVNLLGMTHVERNGHHYVNGMADLPAAEQAAFLAAHPDLYERSHGAVRLRIRAGQLLIASLGCVGFASGAEPDWRAMTPMPERAAIERK